MSKQFCLLVPVLLAFSSGSAVDAQESKGLTRPSAVPAASSQAPASTPVEADAQAAANSELPATSVLLRQFPDPNVELAPAESQPPAPAAGASRLEAVISTTRLSPWERLNKLGNDAFFQGLYGEAEKQFLASVRELKKTNQKDDRLVKSRNNLGSAYLREGKYKDAQEAFELAQQTEKELGQEQSIEAARSLTGLASVFKQTGNLTKSESMFKDALRMREKVEGADTQGVAQCLLDMGELYRAQKLYAEAEPVYQLALETLNKSKDVPELMKAYFLDRTGQFFADQGKNPEAKRCFETALMMKDKYATLYTPGDPRKRGLVYYRCLNGVPNASVVFTRGIQIECLHVKDMSAVATMATQIYGPDWTLLKAEVTILNQGKTAIMALPEQPPFFMEVPREQVLQPLSSDAIATELGLRGRMLYDRIVHSADFAYVLNTTTQASTTMVNTPFGAPTIFNTIGSWTTASPDWGARIQARNSAMTALSGAIGESTTVLRTKPDRTTIAPGEAATFDIFYPYRRFDSGILRFMVGNTVLEFPFGSKSG